MKKKFLKIGKIKSKKLNNYDEGYLAMLEEI